jgi:hypothetical protein
MALDIACGQLAYTCTRSPLRTRVLPTTATSIGDPGRSFSMRTSTAAVAWLSVAVGPQARHAAMAGPSSAAIGPTWNTPRCSGRSRPLRMRPSTCVPVWPSASSCARVTTPCCLAARSNILVSELVTVPAVNPVVEVLGAPRFRFCHSTGGKPGIEYESPSHLLILPRPPGAEPLHDRAESPLRSPRHRGGRMVEPAVP